MNWRRWLARSVRMGAVVAPRVGRVARRTVDVAAETRDAFARGLRGEPEPPPQSRASSQQVAAWYANLELAEGADLDSVHGAWKRLQRRYHPDLHAGDAERARRATELIQELNAAYGGLKRHFGR